jgi:stage III sporulation protein SpoIIIAA
MRQPTFERKHYEMEITDNLGDLMSVLPPDLASAILNVDPEMGVTGLIEIVLDLGRQPEARFHAGEIELVGREVTRADLEHVAERIGHFGDDNRAGIERTLHRISAIRNRSGEIVGLTCRIGRAVYGTIAIIRDLIESGQSVLLLGRPGVGKTTLLRETARVLADELRKRVIIVDTSNEIAGDGDIPHPGIGRARRMQVPTPTAQHAVMIEAVENHMPEVVVIDEIGTEREALAARTIAERGVQLIGTAHGNSLENLMMNPTLADLIGGIQSVTLSDEEARRRGTQKSILERKAPPTFGVIIEIINRDEVAVHADVAATVDTILRGMTPRTEIRRREDDGRVAIVAVDPRRDPKGRVVVGRGGDRRDIIELATRQPPRPADASPLLSEQEFAEMARDDTPPPLPRGRGVEGKPLRIFPFGVSRNRLEQAIQQLGVAALIVREQRDADLVMTLKTYFRRRPQQLREAEARGTPIHVLRANTGIQMESALGMIFPTTTSATQGVNGAALPTDHSPAPTARANRGGENQIDAAMEEAEEAINAVIDGAPPVALAPRAAYIRRLQHQLADRYNLSSRSRGREPNRRVEIYRDGVR